ncbi:hypothetical protein ACQPZJ_01835 [Actinoplanes sp. CA-054009]
MDGVPMNFDRVMPGLRVVRLVDGRAGVVTKVGQPDTWHFSVRLDGDAEAHIHPADEAELFTALLEPGNPLRPGKPRS